MGYFKDLEIDNQNSESEDPNQLKLFGTDSENAPASQPAAPAAVPSAPAEITRPGRLTVKDIRYIEEFLSKRLKVG